ncbi:hypothetical protein N431DRAFT_448651 [Stipitochalara longipes BDJ]|nr:hypothetical protein N431DRAFT_448651 [Stipitochalara longipes BDJ]
MHSPRFTQIASLTLLLANTHAWQLNLFSSYISHEPVRGSYNGSIVMTLECENEVPYTFNGTGGSLNGGCYNTNITDRAVSYPAPCAEASDLGTGTLTIYPNPNCMGGGYVFNNSNNFEGQNKWIMGVQSFSVLSGC